MKGLTKEEFSDRMALFGPNSIDIPAKTTWQLLVDEVNLTSLSII
jgi:hypothetical protein